MVLSELQALVKEQILITIPALEALLTVDELTSLVNVAVHTPATAVLQDLDDRLSFGGSYVDKVAELRTDLQIGA